MSEFLRKNKKQLLLFSIVFFVGIFLRTYQFHNWLVFESDQARDATLVGQILKGERTWPLLGPSMRKSENVNGELFHLGPIYYHLQIISAKLFGNMPASLAYPDLFFGVLTIPLFYLFLKKYFSQNLALGIGGLYAISFFAIRYARFAWNPNLIPFFVILFLLALYEFMMNREKTHWTWALFLGIAIGVGVQLHVTLIFLFPVTSFIVFAYLLKKNWRILKQLGIILTVALIVNSSQLISEYRNNFTNTKIFFSSSLQKSDKEGGGKLIENLGKNLDCHIEANSHILSSLGEDDCNLSYIRLLSGDKNRLLKENLQNPLFFIGSLLEVSFSLFGYGAFVYCFRKEKDRNKRYFLGLIILYAALSFLVMLIVIGSGMTEYRYFIHSFFMPFIFLGFLTTLFIEKFAKKGLGIVLVIFFSLMIANSSTIKNKYQLLWTGNQNKDNLVVLGETERMADYLIVNAKGEGEIYLVGDTRYVSNFFRSLIYLTKDRGLNMVNIGSDGIAPAGKRIFYICKNGPYSSDQNINDRKIKSKANFGRVSVYELEN